MAFDVEVQQTKWRLYLDQMTINICFFITFTYFAIAQTHTKMYLKKQHEDHHSP